jgi:putative oxidoreductase
MLASRCRAIWRQFWQKGSEHVFTIPLVLGLFTRTSELALPGVTMVIEMLACPEAWWPMLAPWAALALMLIIRGGGAISLDAALLRMRGR